MPELVFGLWKVYSSWQAQCIILLNWWTEHLRPRQIPRMNHFQWFMLQGKGTVFGDFSNIVSYFDTAHGEQGGFRGVNSYFLCAQFIDLRSSWIGMSERVWNEATSTVSYCQCNEYVPEFDCELMYRLEGYSEIVGTLQTVSYNILLVHILRILTVDTPCIYHVNRLTATNFQVAVYSEFLFRISHL